MCEVLSHDHAFQVNINIIKRKDIKTKNNNKNIFMSSGKLFLKWSSTYTEDIRGHVIFYPLIQETMVFYNVSSQSKINSNTVQYSISQY